MKTLLYRLFVINWPRKAIAAALAIVVWFAVAQSLSMTKTISRIPVRVVNITQGMTVEGMKTNGVLSKKITLTLTGTKSLLEDLNASDLEVVIDAQGQTGDWVATVKPKNIVSLNPEKNLLQGIRYVGSNSFIVKITPLVTEKITVVIPEPIGEAPRGYQYLDVWPYQLKLTVSGPKATVNKLKKKGLKLVFNLGDITADDLDAIDSSQDDVVSYYVPNSWKEISIPDLSETPIAIDSPDAKLLRIDFRRTDIIPLHAPLSVDVFYLPRTANILNPSKARLATNDLVRMQNGIKVFGKPLLVKGVSELFLNVVKDYLELSIIATEMPNGQSMVWSIQFMQADILEKRYVAMLMKDTTDQELSNLNPQVREEYLRNRFRMYMNRLRLYVSEEQPLSLFITREGNQIVVKESGPS